MKNPASVEKTAGNRPARYRGTQVLAMVAGSVVLAVVATVFVIRFFFFPAPFRPVELDEREKQELAVKLDRIETASGVSLTDLFGPVGGDELTPEGYLKPEPYTEEGASREIVLTERELNALFANNTDLARKLAIDLSDDLLSAKLLLPLDPDFPVLGGKTVRVKAGLELALRDGRPVVKLRGISLLGIPLPNAWLGGIKNIDLVEEYGGGKGFWKGFADGIDTLRVQEGVLVIRLNE
ncbi:arginine N-succinyltransferase [Prosthecochloris sp. GSB1]|uniref:arginine N-succinyltransferase n=1 Tax=Prosthecochloris sp. GSB1 TaxID=281093 RepID=UPI000B8CD985|nr:arginine N-succinyltransferase [Prosthecochloris sp. GSB1]ASQ90058.1 arginine N-succinyltransferase [Prosthecochloris sp. GSB1]